MSSPNSIEPIEIKIGHASDPFRDFPSTATAVASRNFDKTGEPTIINTIGHEAIFFIENYCRLTNGQFTGQPFNLLKWQKRLLLEMYEMVKNGKGEWRLRYRDALVGVAKKNGKTELVAALGLFHCLAAGEISAEVICAACDREQAGLVFKAAKSMTENSPQLKEYSKILKNVIEFSDDTGKNNATLKTVSTVGGGNDGLNLSAAIIDELHEWVKPEAKNAFTVLTQAGLARTQPINIMITTAGHDQTTILYGLYDRGERIKSGEIIDDPSFYSMWWAADDKDDFTDPEIWKKANPSWGHIMEESIYASRLKATTENIFRRYYLNQWTEAEEVWEPAQWWDDLEKENINFINTLPLWIGVDIGNTYDNSAVVWLQEQGGKIMVDCKIWVNPHSPSSDRYSEWEMDKSEVRDFIRALCQKYPKPAMQDENNSWIFGPAVIYDPAFFNESAQMLEEDDNINMVEFPQTPARLEPAAQNIFEHIKDGKIRHTGNPTMRRHMRSVKAVESSRGRWAIKKPKGSNAKIDAVIAMAMALYVMTSQPKEQEIQFWIK